MSSRSVLARGRWRSGWLMPSINSGSSRWLINIIFRRYNACNDLEFLLICRQVAWKNLFQQWRKINYVIYSFVLFSQDTNEFINLSINQGKNSFRTQFHPFHAKRESFKVCTNKRGKEFPTRKSLQTSKICINYKKNFGPQRVASRSLPFPFAKRCYAAYVSDFHNTQKDRSIDCYTALDGRRRKKFHPLDCSLPE